MSYRGTLHDRPWWWSRDVYTSDLDKVMEEIDSDVSAVARANRALREQVRELSTVVGVLIERLESQGLVDRDELLTAVSEALAPPTAAPPTAAPDVAPIRMVSCAKCGTKVPTNRTNITEKLGEVCDACFDAMG